MNDLLLVRAESQNSAAIHGLIKDVLDHYELHHLRPVGVDNDIDDLDNAYMGNQGFFWIAKDSEGSVVASVAIFKLDAMQCELRKMYLRINQQGKGYGKMLLNTAIEKAKELGYRTMRLKTNSKLVNAIELYKKYGFNFSVITDSEKYDDCDIAMELTL